MIFKTMREQEREAYITGHTGMANIMAAAHDLELAEVEQENREWEKDEEIKTLNEQAKATDEKLSAAKVILLLEVGTRELACCPNTIKPAVAELSERPALIVMGPVLAKATKLAAFVK